MSEKIISKDITIIKDKNIIETRINSISELEKLIIVNRIKLPFFYDDINVACFLVNNENIFFTGNSYVIQDAFNNEIVNNTIFSLSHLQLGIKQNLSLNYNMIFNKKDDIIAKFDICGNDTFLKELMNNLKSDANIFAFCGNKGIGKTTWLLYFLYNIRTANRSCYFNMKILFSNKYTIEQKKQFIMNEITKLFFDTELDEYILFGLTLLKIIESSNLEDEIIWKVINTVINAITDKGDTRVYVFDEYKEKYDKGYVHMRSLIKTLSKNKKIYICSHVNNKDVREEILNDCVLNQENDKPFKYVYVMMNYSTINYQIEDKYIKNQIAVLGNYPHYVEDLVVNRTNQKSRNDFLLYETLKYMDKLLSFFTNNKIIYAYEVLVELEKVINKPITDDSLFGKIMFNFPIKLLSISKDHTISYKMPLIETVVELIKEKEQNRLIYKSLSIQDKDEIFYRQLIRFLFNKKNIFDNITKDENIIINQKKDLKKIKDLYIKHMNKTALILNKSKPNEILIISNGNVIVMYIIRESNKDIQYQSIEGEIKRIKLKFSYLLNVDISIDKFSLYLIFNYNEFSNIDLSKYETIPVLFYSIFEYSFYTSNKELVRSLHIESNKSTDISSDSIEEKSTDDITFLHRKRIIIDDDITIKHPK